MPDIPANLFNPVVTGGSFEARDVRLTRSIAAFHTLRTEDSRIRVTNAVVTESVAGLGAVLASNCDIRYEGNTVEAWQFGVDLSQSATLDPEGWVPSQPSRFMVARNTVQLTQNMPILSAGIRAIDDFAGSPGGRRLEAWVANNDITLTGIPAPRFGIRLIGSEGARLVNNKIGGDGRGGVLVDFARGCRVQSTSFEAFTPQGPARVPVAHLLLGPNSGDCVAVTVPASATVIDAGTNNVVRRTAQ